MSEVAEQFPETDVIALPPVEVSGEAHKALAAKLREWSGWGDASLIFGNPNEINSAINSRVAACNQTEHQFIVNVDKTTLNPNRVIRTVTPFRLRQEAVTTGAMLHEAGHARHSHWRPRSDAEAADWSGKGLGWVHPDGSAVTKQQVALACLMEEPRIEGLMARDAHLIGAAGLGWTMRASAAHLLPMTTLSALPEQQIMDLITTWALRAGRLVAVSHHTGQVWPKWVGDFNYLLTEELKKYLSDQGSQTYVQDADEVFGTLQDMAISTDDTGLSMVSKAKHVLDILYPDGQGDDESAMPQQGCGAVELANEGDEGESDDAEGEGAGVSEGSDTGDGTEGEDSAAEGGYVSSVLAQKLEDLEKQADASGETQAEADEQKAGDKPGGTAGGVGSGNRGHTDYRKPNKDERQYQKDAERFLRRLINPAEQSIVRLTDSPAATVDGAALSAWKAGGQRREPRFFKQTRREVRPMPPVDVAILGDISGSMDDLQQPQAVLSWALAAAALDLRNFAGRGQQIRSCMIHWGDKAEVVHHVGDPLPGIREVPCTDGTYALGPAMRCIEEEMPGFLSPPSDGKPTNRLIVMFTDWDHASMGRQDAIDEVSRALQAGVNIVTIAPRNYTTFRSLLPEIERVNPFAPGISSISKYDPHAPSMVWDEAAKALGH
jgi:hypothetical protein